MPVSSTNQIARNKYRIWIGSPISVLHHPVLIRLRCNAVNVLDDRMHNPPHPGEKLSKLWLDPLELSVTRAAEALDVSRKTLSENVNGKAAISPEMAMRLEIAFGKSARNRGSPIKQRSTSGRSVSPVTTWPEKPLVVRGGEPWPKFAKKPAAQGLCGVFLESLGNIWQTSGPPDRNRTCI
ncbi:MAG TPA: HigA family addiction module antitoxin [Trinickia sp.]|nr:HigA family addiction module antitoxin [Trinickia sp.]